MQKIAFYSKWLDNPNGSVKDCPKNEMEQNETGTQNPAKPSNSTAGLLGRMVKGVVSFLQNLLSPLTQKEGVCAEKVSRLRALSQTTAVGTLYGLLFAGLLFAPFQSHRATAVSLSSDDTVEAQNIKRKIEQAVLLFLGAVLDNVLDWAYDGARWVYHGGKTPPPDKFVIVTDIVQKTQEGTEVHWYSNMKSGEGEVSTDTLNSTFTDKDESYYWLRIWSIDWNEHSQRYVTTTNSWFYWGNGYIPNYTPDQLTPAMMGRHGDAETGKTGYYIASGYTVNVDIMSEWYSRFESWKGKYRKLLKSSVEGEPDDPGYNPVAYVYLSDMRYTWTTDWINSGGSIFGFEREEKIYTPRSKPVKHSTRMSAIKTEKKEIDTNPKNTRLDRQEMKKHKSKMFYKMVKTIVKEEGEEAPFINPDGTEGTTILQQDIYQYVPIRQHKVYPKDE